MRQTNLLINYFFHNSSLVDNSLWEMIQRVKKCINILYRRHVKLPGWWPAVRWRAIPRPGSSAGTAERRRSSWSGCRCGRRGGRSRAGRRVGPDPPGQSGCAQGGTGRPRGETWGRRCPAGWDSYCSGPLYPHSPAGRYLARQGQRSLSTPKYSWLIKNIVQYTQSIAYKNQAGGGGCSHCKYVQMFFVT